MPALMDEGAIFENGMEEGELAFEHALGELLEADPDFEVAPVSPPREMIPVDDAELPPFAVDGFVVKWDFWSHSSGRRRGYVKCHTHATCFRYSQLNLYSSPRDCAAYLLAWAKCGPTVPRETHVASAFAPLVEDVADILTRL